MLVFCSSVESASFEDVEELVAEFKMLHRIGPHHHIVSLLGAVICNGETVKCGVRCGEVGCEVWCEIDERVLAAWFTPLYLPPSLYINTTVYRDILHCIGVCQWWQPSQCLEGEETRGNQSSLADEAGLRASDCKGNVLLSQQTGSWVNCKCEWF